jgi:hypothetical protein
MSSYSIYIFGQIDTWVWSDHLGPIPSQTLIKSKKYSGRLLVLSAAITNLGTMAVLHECSRTLNCHFYKREGSNSDWHSCSRWLRGWCQPYHHPLILRQYQTNAEFVPHVLLSFSDFESTNIVTLHELNNNNSLAQNVVILTFIEIRSLRGQYTIGTNWTIQLLV